MVTRTFDRRDFLKLMGAATGTSVLAGCNLDRTTEKLIPYLVPPEDGVLPGKATFVATSCTECPAGCGVSARIRDERPVKVDGIASHPVGGSGLCMRGQASINRLYLPERIRGPLMQDGNGNLTPGTWNQALARVVRALGESGRENVFLSGRTDGSFSALVGEFCAAMGVRRLPEYELFSYAAIREANRQLLGRAALPWYDISACDFLLTVGADVVDTFQNPVAHARAIAERRARRTHDGDHFAWYHAEPHASLSGLQSDHRLAVAPGSESHLLAYLLRDVASRRVFVDRLLEGNIAAVPVVTLDDAATATGLAREAIEGLAEALSGAHHPLVVAGGVSTAGEQGLDVARIATLLHVATGAIGSTVDFTHAQDWSTVGSMADMADFMERLESGSVGVAFLSRTDPVSTLPDGERFRESIDRAHFIVGIGDTLTETMKQCDVVLPVSHALESWGDTEPRRGVVGAIQPAFGPLFDTRSDGDILISVMTEAGRIAPAPSYQEYAIARWNRNLGAARAQELVEKGFVDVPVSQDEPRLTGRAGSFGFPSRTVTAPVLVVAPSLRWYDGRSKVLPLLQEIPDPITTVSWGGWVSVSPQSGIVDKEEVELSVGGWKATLPARVQPGLGKGVFAVQRGVANPPLGWATESGECGAWVAGVTVRTTGIKLPLAVLSGSMVQEGRGIVPGDHPAHFGHPLEPQPHDHEDVSFNPKPAWKDYRWSMAIDMDRCVGCAACVAACYVENNVPIVGEDEHLRGREMAWIRVEPYYEEDGSAEFVPAMCQHCDQAPCESVCPVFATYTSDEGLNNQVYNRCVGTRYCSNNCPYKMRRFNWFPWDKRRVSPMELMVNPDVSLRGKGIMEKCSFCVQRIRTARHDAKDRNADKWKIEDGEVTTACAQACPGNAIVFGNILDENSQVAKWAKSERAHRMLEELGTGPAVFYLRTKGNDHGA
jgi:molybdopterin-containing oxidoreductase family iron-sulfur binding subunit